jgi:Signal transduction histidine kinase
LQLILNKIKSYDKLSSDSLKLSFLISNLLKTTLTTKKAKIKAEHINLLEVLDLVQTSLKNNIILLEPQINYASSLPSFYGFKVQIYQLLKNLIENALKYSHPNREPIINISFTKENRSLTIIIEDNGIGVPERKQKEIFYLFSQSRQFDMSKGMGMGLNICKKIVTSYRGQIRLESTEGKGCKFIITLKELKEK